MLGTGAVRPTQTPSSGPSSTSAISTSTLALLPSWHHTPSPPDVPRATALYQQSPRKHGVLQSQAVNRRSRPVQPLQQGLCAIHQKWQGPENCERAVSTTRHSLLVKSVQSVSGDCANRLLEKRFDSSHLTCTARLTPSSITFCAIRHTSRINQFPKWPISRSRHQRFSYWNGSLRSRNRLP